MVRVDGVVTVVDCANFARISNFSRIAKLQAERRLRAVGKRVRLVSTYWVTHFSLPAAQAKCTDLVLLNKVELAGESLLEQVSK